MREGWEIKTLADLFDIGSSKRVYESQWRNSGVPFYRAREIVKLSREGFVDNELFIDEDLYNEYANKYGIPKCGDIMVTGVGTLGVCYIVKENDKFYFKDGNTLWFKTKKGTNPFFVNYAFKSYFLRQQIDNCNGATVGTLTIVRAKQIIIPVPPLSEQQRIVSELDLLSSIIEKKKAQLKEYEQLAQSIFYDMFGDPVTNEKGWEVKKLNESVQEMFLGPFGSALKVDSYVPVEESYCMVYEQKHAIQGTISLDNHYINNEKYKSLKRFEVKPLDFIMSCRGTIGKIFHLPPNAPIGIIHPSLMKIRIREDVYDYAYFQFMLTKVVANESTNGNCVQMAITAKELGKKMLTIPPLSLQQSFAEKIESIEKQKSLIQQSIVETQTLFDSRMDYYFN